MSPLVLPILAIGEKLIDKFFTSPEEKAKAQLELYRMEQEGELKVILSQIDVNAKEAQHSSIFVAGWRPFIGWICGAGLAYQVLFYDLLVWLSSAHGWKVPPTPNLEVLAYVLGGILGLGGFRTFEKTKGVAK